MVLPLVELCSVAEMVLVLLTLGRFDSNGDLGIGIDNPQERLHVSSVILATGETPQIRLNSSAADASDNDRSMLGQATWAKLIIL